MVSCYAPTCFQHRPFTSSPWTFPGRTSWWLARSVGKERPRRTPAKSARCRCATTSRNFGWFICWGWATPPFRKRKQKRHWVETKNLISEMNWGFKGWEFDGRIHESVSQKLCANGEKGVLSLDHAFSGTCVRLSNTRRWITDLQRPCSGNGQWTFGTRWSHRWESLPEDLENRKDLAV